MESIAPLGKKFSLSWEDVDATKIPFLVSPYTCVILNLGV
jgi:hypothetical protein